MSNDSADKRQAFERWVSALRPHADASPAILGEDSGVTSLDEQATLVRRLPNDVVRLLREREAGRHLPIDQDSTAIFHPPADLIARARRLVPPPKPERSVPPDDPITESMPQPVPTPVVTPLVPRDTVAQAELPEPALPTLADAIESEPPPLSLHEPAAEPPPTSALQPRRAARFPWTAAILVSAILAASAWFVLTRWDWVIQTVVEQSARRP
jgi:hypothetical protein